MSTFRVAIIGAGFGGIGLGILLKQAGIPFVVLEKAGGIGGTWRDNVYPGAACDVPSHLYSFSFERKTDWTRRFAEQPEILAYLEHCVDAYGLAPHLRLDTEVTEARFLDGRWRLSVTAKEDRENGAEENGGRENRDGDEIIEADVLVSACGQLNRPSIPSIPGLETFGGTVFHSARWDHSHDLTGRRVAVIGTGASAIQFVPHVAEQAAELTVYQRTAPYVIPKPDRVYGAVTRRLLGRVPALHDLDRLRTYLFFESRALGFVTYPPALKTMEASFRRTLKQAVPDRALRAKLHPDHPLGCKRVLISDDYYPALQRPNVALVTDPIKEVRQNAVVTEDGRVRTADTLILGTGFRSTEFLAPMAVHGRNGRELSEEWRDGAQAHLGITVHGFPNLYLLYGPNTNLGHNSIIYMLESQFSYVMACIRSGHTLEVRKDVQNAFNDEVRRRMRTTVWNTGCTSWYQTADGKHVNNWPGYTFAYRRATRRPDPRDFSVG
ncbi:NAD(P)/FAD-dependent oxidoreductase [Actinocorallia longicatena]|uniref:NAD(P)/FAD-dependent oxidoreductase n=1 Tax=Actinocorallia longicatena TaxID=111803 RepID=A0ABP6QG89_9ACTN